MLGQLAQSLHGGSLNGFGSGAALDGQGATLRQPIQRGPKYDQWSFARVKPHDNGMDTSNLVNQGIQTRNQSGASFAPGAMSPTAGTPQTTSSVPTNPAGVPSGTGTFNTINTPQPIFTPNMTSQAVNQAVADSRSQADPRWAMKQFNAPGRSNDAGTLSAAMPGIGDALMQGQMARSQIPLQDYIANQNNMLGGQVNQENESLGLAQLLGRLGNDQSQNQMSWLQTLMGPLMSQLTG